MGSHAKPTAIEVTGLEKSFNGQPIVHPTDLSVATGELALLTGQSGSGKSTLLRMIAGIERPDDGSVSIDGTDVWNLSQRRRAKFISRVVGVGFQTPNLDTGLSVAHNVVGLAAVTSGKVDYVKAGELTERFGVSHLLDRSAATLSGGEKLRVALARLYMTEPSVILLDEPTNMIDPSGKRDVLASIAELGQDGRTTLLISHDEQAADFATQEIRFGSGHIIDIL